MSRVYQNSTTHALAMKSASEDLPPGVYAVRFKPGVNFLRYLFGLKCQSTVHNRTDEVVYAIASDRIMGTTRTTEKNGKLGTTPASAPAAAEGALSFGKKVEKGPTPAAIIPVAPHRCHTFILDDRSYYLTCCTKKETGVAYHAVQKKVPGYNDYVITPNDLQYHVSVELAEEIMEMIGLATKKRGDSMS